MSRSATDLRCKLIDEIGIAVSGATGYLGRLTCDALGAQGRQVALELLPAGTVLVHLAADVRNTADAFLANLTMDTRVAELAVAGTIAGVVYASTNNVYPLGERLTSDKSTAWNDFYAAAKITGECLLRMHCKPGFHHAVRLADVFGAGQRHGNFFKAMSAAIRERNALVLQGDGAKKRSYIYGPDAARYLAWAATNMRSARPLPTTTNLCYDTAPTLAEIVGALSRFTGLPVVHVSGPSGVADVRTMAPGPLQEFGWQWPDTADALANFAAMHAA